MRKRHLCQLTAVLTHSTLTEAQNFVLVTKTKTTREACTRKHEKRREARVRRHDQPPVPTPQEVNNGQVQDVTMSVVICDSVVHLSKSGPHEYDSQLFFSFFFFVFGCFFIFSFFWSRCFFFHCFAGLPSAGLPLRRTTLGPSSATRALQDVQRNQMCVVKTLSMMKSGRDCRNFTKYL